MNPLPENVEAALQTLRSAIAHRLKGHQQTGAESAHENLSELERWLRKFP